MIGIKEFSQAKKHLKNSQGISYIEFLNTLKPNYIKVWTDLCLGYLAVILCMMLSLYALRAKLLPVEIVILIGSFFVGYFFHYIQTFFHAAAHLNIHPSRKWNDKLTNLFISSWLGFDIKRYRIIHFQHHSCHGTTLDSEISYFNPLTFPFLLKSLFGIYTLKVGISYLMRTKNYKTEHNSQKQCLSQILLGGFLHLFILIIDLLQKIKICAKRDLSLERSGYFYECQI